MRSRISATISLSTSCRVPRSNLTTSAIASPPTFHRSEIRLRGRDRQSLAPYSMVFWGTWVPRHLLLVGPPGMPGDFPPSHRGNCCGTCASSWGLTSFTSVIRDVATFVTLCVAPPVGLRNGGAVVSKTAFLSATPAVITGRAPAVTKTDTHSWNSFVVGNEHGLVGPSDTSSGWVSSGPAEKRGGPELLAGTLRRPSAAVKNEACAG